MAAAATEMKAIEFGQVDYVECRDAGNLTRVEGFDITRPARVFVAAWLGNARLIDNVPVETPGENSV